MARKRPLGRRIGIWGLFTTLSIGYGVTGILYYGANLNNGKAPLGYRLPVTITEFYEHLSRKPEPLNKKSDVDTVMPWQNALEALGYSVGECGADGIYGQDTIGAIKRYQGVKKLPVTGIGDTATLAALYKDIARDKAIQGTLERIILSPFRRDDVKAFMANLPQYFTREADTSPFYRPDLILWTTIYQLLTDESYYNKESRRVYGPCANSKEADAYRHAHFVLTISKPLPYAGAPAASLLNLRERLVMNEPGILLTDMFNHSQAAKVVAGLQPFFWQNPSVKQIVQARIADGSFILRPFPLVPKSSVP